MEKSSYYMQLGTIRDIRKVKSDFGHEIVHDEDAMDAVNRWKFFVIIYQKRRISKKDKC